MQDHKKPDDLEPKDMSRATQTKIIAWILVIIGLGALYFATRADPSDPYAECQHFLGFYDAVCMGHVASDALERSF